MTFDNIIKILGGKDVKPTDYRYSKECLVLPMWHQKDAGMECLAQVIHYVYQIQFDVI